MSRLFSLRMRLVGGVVLVCLALTAAAWFALTEAADAARARTTPEQLAARQARIERAVEAEVDALRARLLEVAASPADIDRIVSGDTTALLLRLAGRDGSRNAWLATRDGQVLGFMGAREMLPRSANARELGRRAGLQGKADGFALDPQGAALVVGVRLPVPLEDMVIYLARDVNDAFASDLALRSGSELMMFRRRDDGSLNRLGTFAANSTSAALQGGLTANVLASLDQSAELRLPNLDTVRIGRLADSLYFAALPVGSSLSGLLDDTATRILVYCLGALLALGVGCWLYASRVVKTLGRLSQGARAYANGKYQTTVKAGGFDELVRFTEIFNLLGQTLNQREIKTFQQANRDGVTGLPSRTLFEAKMLEMVGVARSGKKQLALITVVVDRLRDVHDSLGRKGGDMMLVEVADRIRRTLRVSRKRHGSGTFLARLATYEFGIIAQDMDAESARSLARRVAEALDRRIEYDGQSVVPGARIGVALYPDHGIDAGGLLYSADIAASNAGAELSRVAMFDASFERDRERQLGMLKELQHAIEHHELYIALLPKISLRGGSELMAEALMRWEHPERGALNPGEFIPFAEKTGFITQLTNWMVGAALDIAAQWQARGTPLTISVNISPRDLDSPDFATAVVERLRARKLRGQVLTLEVVESAVLDATPTVRQNLDVLSRLGVRIAIDDFGSGFASLDQLRSLPLDTMMVDRQFVRGLPDDESSRIIVQAAIDIGHNLGLTVVGEGVETDDQMRMLRQMGCDQAQGFFVAKPLTGEQFEAWVVERSASFSDYAEPVYGATERLSGIDDSLAELGLAAAGADLDAAGVMIVDEAVGEVLGDSSFAQGPVPTVSLDFDFGNPTSHESAPDDGASAFAASADDEGFGLDAFELETDPSGALVADAGEIELIDLGAPAIPSGEALSTTIELVPAGDDEDLRSN
ncbi:MAG: bifunctional diguanylate cyclase/phosphodiesterase [Burkholderiaceae bacterium]